MKLLVKIVRPDGEKQSFIADTKLRLASGRFSDYEKDFKSIKFIFVNDAADVKDSPLA